MRMYWMMLALYASCGCAAFAPTPPVTSDVRPSQTAAYLYGRFQMRSASDLRYAFVFRCKDGKEYQIPFAFASQRTVYAIQIAPSACSFSGSIIGVEWPNEPGYYMYEFCSNFLPKQGKDGNTLVNRMHLPGACAPTEGRSTSDIDFDALGRSVSSVNLVVAGDRYFPNTWLPQLSTGYKLGVEFGPGIAYYLGDFVVEVPEHDVDVYGARDTAHHTFREWGLHAQTDDAYEKTTTELKHNLPRFAAISTEQRLLLATPPAIQEDDERCRNQWVKCYETCNVGGIDRLLCVDKCNKESSCDSLQE